MSLRTKVIAAISAGLLIVSGIFMAAFASVPDSDDGEIHACRQPVTGNLRVIDAESGATCHASEQQLSWPSEFDIPTLGVQTITNSFTVAANSSNSGTAVCPTGTKLTGGGYSIGDGANPNYRVPASTSNQPDTGWEVAVRNLDTFEITVFVMARCASLS